MAAGSIPLYKYQVRDMSGGSIRQTKLTHKQHSVIKMSLIVSRLFDLTFSTFFAFHKFFILRLCTFDKFDNFLFRQNPNRHGNPHI